MNAITREQIFEEFSLRQREILLAKGNDYATEDVLSNFKLAGNIANQNSDNAAMVSCLNAIATKVARLGNLINSGIMAQNESISDSIIDLANYSFLLHCLHVEEIPVAELHSEATMMVASYDR